MTAVRFFSLNFPWYFRSVQAICVKCVAMLCISYWLAEIMVVAVVVVRAAVIVVVVVVVTAEAI